MSRNDVHDRQSARAADAREGLVLRAYERKVAAGELTSDRAQVALAKRLDAVLGALENARLGAKSSALGWLFGSKRPPQAVKGLYIHGDVGRGKTMLMDLFFEALPGSKKRRAHFHDFMADVHARIHARREAARAGHAPDGDPIPAVAAAIRAEARSLCFDEFTVTDIADAMVLARLFEQLFELGVTLVATSNVAPRDLYRDGLNRARFEPFIAKLEARCDVVNLDALGDYRQGDRERARVYVKEGDSAALQAAWSRFAEGEERPATITRGSRTIDVARAVEGRGGADRSAAWFGFDELCARPLGAPDYAAMADRFRTVLVENVPVFTPALRNEAKRFINLVDTFYDAGTRLIVSAAGEPEALVGSLAGTERFEFDRTASRLTEMRSESWVTRPRRSRSARSAGEVEG